MIHQYFLSLLFVLTFLSQNCQCYVHGIRPLHVNHIVSSKFQHQPIFLNEKKNVFDPFQSEVTVQNLMDTAVAQETSLNLNWNMNNIWVARISLLTVSAFYGSNFGCVKILNQALNPSVAAACRFTLAALIFLPFLLKTDFNPSDKTKSSMPIIMGGFEVGLYCAVAYWSQAQALITSPASTVAFICSLAVVVVPLLDFAFKKDQKKDTMMLSILPALLAALGVACLELGGTEAPGVGDLWATLQPLFFGLGFWRVERHMKKAVRPGDTQRFTGAMMLSVAAASWVWTGFDFILPSFKGIIGSDVAPDAFASAISDAQANIMQQFSHFSDWHVVLAILWTGIVTTALTSFVENKSMKQLSASESTIIYSTEPLWGTAFAAVTLHESMGWNTAVGALFIMSACLWSSVGPTVGTGVLSSTLSTVQDGIEEVYGQAMENWGVIIDRFTTVDNLVD